MRVPGTVLAVLLTSVIACSSSDDSPGKATDDAGADGANADGGGGSSGLLYDRLSETGLYSDIAAGQLAPGVLAYEPAYVLWTDAATKSRWVKIPDGETIDTSDMDRWVYPVGTKLWKDFTRDGVRIETRLLEKTADEWFMMAFVWNTDQTDAEAAPNGLSNAGGTPHDVPAQDKCGKCHDNIADRVIGVSAVLLSHDRGGLVLQDWIDDGTLSDPPSGHFTVPGDATSEPVLGYLHANCGNCHNPDSEVWEKVDMNLWLDVDALSTVEETTIYTTTVNVATTSAGTFGIPTRIVPGDPGASAVHARMQTRGSDAQMPPIGTEDVDASGLALVADWITSLEP